MIDSGDVMMLQGPGRKQNPSREKDFYKEIIYKSVGREEKVGDGVTCKLS